MSSPTKPTPTNELAALLVRLGLRVIAQNLEDLLARATAQKWSARSLLEHMAKVESEDKAQRSLERRLKRSRIGRFKPMADFDWAWPKQIDRALIGSALALEFLTEGRNFILMGPNGIGKTMVL